MAAAIDKVGSGLTLTAILTDRSPLPLIEALKIIRQVARQVQALHEEGTIHRKIGPDSVILDETEGPSLTPPESDCMLGGSSGSLDSSPPEIRSGPPLRLPARISAAQEVLREAGVSLDPRRIDVYQMGALLCRLMTGQSLSGYLRSPKVKSQVPSFARSILERAAGFDSGERLATPQEFGDALDRIMADPRFSQIQAATDDSKATPSRVQTPTKDPDRASPPSPDLNLERLGHYRIVERIGFGGMGDVYKGYEEALDREVAIKVLPESLARHPEFVERFRSEASAAAKLEHPNVVQIHFIGSEAGHHFFVMQFVEGESLAELLKRSGRLETEKALAIVSECLEGLSAAHRQGLVHRDIKPANILLDDRTKRALLTDFGLVQAAAAGTRLTATGVILGTVDYISPEQGQGKVVDGRSDLYSLGVLMFETLSGRLPFEAESPSTMIYKHAFENPPLLTEIAPDVPKPIVAVIEKLLAKDPDDRYQTAEEVQADIRAFREGKPVSAMVSPVSRPQVDSEETKQDEFDPFVSDSIVSGHVESSFDFESWAPPAGWRGLVFRVKDIFRAHAADFHEKLQSTTAQVDDAIDRYEKRNKALLASLQEAAEAIAELTVQARHQEEAAAKAASSAERASCEKLAADLRRQIAEHHRELEPLKEQSAKVISTLEQLKSQRDALFARLKAAEGRIKLAGGTIPSKHRRWVPVAVATAACAGLLIVGVWAISGLFGERYEAPRIAREPPIDSPIEIESTGAPSLEVMPILAEGVLLAEMIAPKIAEPIGLAPGVIHFQNRARSRTNDSGTVKQGISHGILTQAAGGWETTGTKWSFRYSRKGNSRGVRLIHPFRNGQVQVNVDKTGVHVFNDNQWSGFTSGQMSANYPSSTTPDYQRIFPLEDSRAYEVVGKLSPDGRYELYMDGTLIMMADIEDAQPMQISDKYKGDQLPYQWKPGQAGFIVGTARDENQNVAEQIHFSPYSSLSTPNRVTTRTIDPDGLEPADALKREDIDPYELAAAGGGDPSKAPAKLVAVLGNSRLKHWDSVKCITFPDENSLVALNGDTVTRWDPMSGHQLHSMSTQGSFTVGLSPDGQICVKPVLFSDDCLQLVESATGNIRASLPLGSRPVAFSRDGWRMASKYDESKPCVAVWNTRTGELHKLTTPGSIPLALGPEGRLLLAGDQTDSLYLVDLETENGKLLHTLEGSAGAGRVADFSPDGRTLVFGNGNLPGTKAWDVETGKEKFSLPVSVTTAPRTGLKIPGTTIAFSPDSLLVATSISLGSVQLWDLATGQLQCTLVASGLHAECIAFNPNGQTLAAGYANGLLRLFDVTSAREHSLSGDRTGALTGLAYSSDGSKIATVGWDSTVNVWDVETSRLLKTFDFPPDFEKYYSKFLTFGPDGGTLACHSLGGMVVWELASGNELEKKDYFNVSCIAFHPDGKRLAIGSNDGIIRITNIMTGQTKVMIDEPRNNKRPIGHVANIAFSPDGGKLASLYLRDKAITLWDTNTGVPQLKLLVDSTNRTSKLAFTPDGRTLSLADRKAFQIWNVATGELIQKVENNDSTIRCYAFSPDIRTLASSHMNATVLLRDVQSGAILKKFVLNPNGGQIEHVAFSPTGRYLATANGNGTVYILRLKETGMNP